MDVDRPLPTPITPEAKPFWDGCRQHRVMLQRCTGCGEYQFYPRPMCHRCMTDTLEWRQVSGRGSVLSHTVVRRPVSRAYAAETPYVIALVRLEEGPTLMSNIVGCDVDRVSVGLAVEVVFEDWSAEISVPKFRPAGSAP